MGTTLRLRILGVTPGEISDSLKSVMKDAGDGSLEGMKMQIADFAKKTKDANQQVADSFGTMADRALQALDRLAQGIQRGDFLSILSGVLGIGLQLGGLGLFGSKVATNINSQGGRIPGFANGTRYAPGGLAMVGERGRELVNLPRGSQVIPNRDLSGMMGPTRIVVGVDPKNGSIQPYVDSQIVQAAPAIMQGGASLAGQQMSRQARRRT
jgi:phage-related tail protein